jgi:hypothetical protein
LRENRVCKDIDSLKELLVRSGRKQRTIATANALGRPIRIADDEDSESCSLVLSKTEGLHPSKKRMYLWRQLVWKELMERWKRSALWEVPSVSGRNCQ